jgi:hypothetical protein
LHALNAAKKSETPESGGPDNCAKVDHFVLCVCKFKLHLCNKNPLIIYEYLMKGLAISQSQILEHASTVLDISHQVQHQTYLVSFYTCRTQTQILIQKCQTNNRRVSNQSILPKVDGECCYLKPNLSCLFPAGGTRIDWQIKINSMIMPHS